MTVLHMTIISNLVRDCIVVAVTVFLMWLEGTPWLGMRDPKQNDLAPYPRCRTGFYLVAVVTSGSPIPRQAASCDERKKMTPTT